MTTEEEQQILRWLENWNCGRLTLDSLLGNLEKLLRKPCTHCDTTAQVAQVILLRAQNTERAEAAEAEIMRLQLNTVSLESVSDIVNSSQKILLRAVDAEAEVQRLGGCLSDANAELMEVDSLRSQLATARELAQEVDDFCTRGLLHSLTGSIKALKATLAEKETNDGK